MTGSCRWTEELAAAEEKLTEGEAQLAAAREEYEKTREEQTQQLARQLRGADPRAGNSCRRGWMLPAQTIAEIQGKIP